MSVETTNRVWKTSTRGGASLLLLLAMADWADDWGYCHPSIDQMAVKCRQTERNILNLLADLEGAGMVRRVARGKGGRGKASGSVYQVTAGMRPEEIAASQQVSPLARMTLAKLQSGELAHPLGRKMEEKISGEKNTPEKTDPDPSSVFPCALKELINVSDNSPSPSARAEALYRKVRPTHLTIPNSDQRVVALQVLEIYLQRFGSEQEAADALQPFAAEADARGISPTNLCWLSEWAAVGQIPAQRKKNRKGAKPQVQEDLIDYDAIRARMEAELVPLIADGERSAA